MQSVDGNKNMIIEIDEEFLTIKLYHSIKDTKPYKVLDIIDLIDFWENNHEQQNV